MNSFKYKNKTIHLINDSSIVNNAEFENFVKEYAKHRLCNVILPPLRGQKKTFTYTPEEMEKESNIIVFRIYDNNKLISIDIDDKLEITFSSEGFHDLQLMSEAHSSVQTDFLSRFRDISLSLKLALRETPVY